MNPFPMVRADLRGMSGTAFLIVLLVAIAVALSVVISIQERGVRSATARAADDFDLLIGAPGSQTQLVLTTVYLQPEALPLASGALLDGLAADKRVKAMAPIAFGDIVRGYPVVGTTREFATRWGKVASPAEGRHFDREGEAVIGWDVRMALGEAVTPAHAMAGHDSRPGETSESEASHRHGDVRYVIVGRLPKTGTPWDWAILVPIESVWETHGLGNGHADGDERIGAPFLGDKTPGVPAIVVKPRSVADAYVLRGQYRQGGTMALFPAEVLVSLYRSVGDVKGVLLVAAAVNNLLIFIAIALVVVTIAGVRRRRYAVLRALGAPRLYVAAVIWLGAAAMIVSGCVLGLLLARVAAGGAALLIAEWTGLEAPQGFAMEDGARALWFAVLGCAIALVPAFIGARRAGIEDLR